MDTTKVVEKLTSDKILDFFTNSNPVNLLIFVIFVTVVLWFFYKQNSNSKKIGDSLVDLEKAMLIFKTKNEEKDQIYMSKIDSVKDKIVDDISDLNVKVTETRNVVDNLKDMSIKHYATKCNGKSNVEIDFNGNGLRGDRHE
jgi:signal recognition particle receptor subunit beta